MDKHVDVNVHANEYVNVNVNVNVHFVYCTCQKCAVKSVFVLRRDVCWCDVSYRGGCLADASCGVAGSVD